jgi:hypothetical protein
MMGYLFGFIADKSGIVVADDKGDDDTDTFDSEDDFKHFLNKLLKDINEYLSEVYKNLEERVSSGEVDINTNIESVEPTVSETVQEFVDFYHYAKQWFKENEGLLYYFGNLTLSDGMDYKNDMIRLFRDLNDMMKRTFNYIKEFQRNDLRDNAEMLKNMLAEISDAPHILELANGETDEELLRNYEETFIESLRHLDDFVPNFMSLLDSLYYR